MKRINPAMVILALSTLPSSAQAMINDCRAVAAGNPGESALNTPLSAAVGSPSELARETFLFISASNSNNSCTYLDADNGSPGVYASQFSASRPGTALPDTGKPGSHKDESRQGGAPGLAAIDKAWPNDGSANGRSAGNDRASIGNAPPQMLIPADRLTGDHEFVLDLLLDAGMFSENKIELDTAPEAATVILLGLGLYGIGVARRR